MAQVDQDLCEERERTKQKGRCGEKEGERERGEREKEEEKERIGVFRGVFFQPTHPHPSPPPENQNRERERPHSMPEMPLCKPRKSTTPSKLKKKKKLSLFSSPIPDLYGPLSGFCLGRTFYTERERKRKQGEGTFPFLSLSLSLSIYLYLPLFLHYLFTISLRLYLYDLLLAPPLIIVFSSTFYFSIFPFLFSVLVVERRGEEKMMKKARRVPLVESSPSSSSYMAAGEEARARFKYQGLLQDYEELVKETEAKKQKLQWTKQKKLRLVAEVKFLRRKYRSLLENPSQVTPSRVKKQSRKMPSTSVCIHEQPNPIVQSEIPTKDRNHRVVEAAAPSTSTAIDLNQISLPNGEEMEEFRVGWEPLKLEKSKRCSTDGEGGANDLKLSICRDVGNNSNRVGKRKISWQDQVALRV